MWKLSLIILMVPAIVNAHQVQTGPHEYADDLHYHTYMVECETTVFWITDHVPVYAEDVCPMLETLMRGLMPDADGLPVLKDKKKWKPDENKEPEI